MKRNFDAVHEQLTTALQAAMQEPNLVLRYTNCVLLAESAISRMKEMIIADPFPSSQEEIFHFKYEAPLLYSQLFYYQALMKSEDDRTYADLLRRSAGQPSGDGPDAFPSPHLTIGTDWRKWPKAQERLQQYLREEMSPGVSPTNAAGIRTLEWTSGKGNLIVLIYVLSLAGCFNKNTVKEVFESFEEHLNIDLKQYYSALNKASFRKDPAAWLKTLPDILLQKFDSKLD